MFSQPSIGIDLSENELNLSIINKKRQVETVASFPGEILENKILPNSNQISKILTEIESLVNLKKANIQIGLPGSVAIIDKIKIPALEKMPPEESAHLFKWLLKFYLLPPVDQFKTYINTTDSTENDLGMELTAIRNQILNPLKKLESKFNLKFNFVGISSLVFVHFFDTYFSSPSKSEDIIFILKTSAHHEIICWYNYKIEHQFIIPGNPPETEILDKILNEFDKIGLSYNLFETIYFIGDLLEPQQTEQFRPDKSTIRVENFDLAHFFSFNKQITQELDSSLIQKFSLASCLAYLPLSKMKNEIS